MTATNVYVEGGTYATTIAVKDGGGLTATATGSAQVSDPDFVATGKAIAPVEGIAFTGVVATFNDAYLSVTSPNVTASIVWGDGHTSAGTVAYSYALGAFAVTGTDTYAEEGTDSVVTTLTDYDGATLTATSTATVADAPLTPFGTTIAATRNVAFSGVVASFTDADPNGTATDYSATINWGNGTSNAGTIVYNSSLQKFTVSGTNTYATEGTFAIAVTIRDSGGATVIASSTANVPDFAVTATAVAVSATEGAAFTGTVATFTDADPNGVLADFSATIAWGDGHTSTGTISFNASTHSGTVTGTNTYAEEGTFPIAVKVHDVGGASASASPSATVADAALSSTGINFSAVAGIAFSRSVATFTDADPGGLSGDDSVSIAWGDSSTSSGYVTYSSANHDFVANGGHTYAAVGTYTARITITDAGGASTVATDTVTVTQAAAGDTGIPVDPVEGAAFTGVVAIFTGAAAQSATITWGDGHSSAGTIAWIAAANAYSVTGTNTYAEEGSYTVGVTITYSGSNATASTTAIVADAALTGTGASLSGTEGVALTGVIATFTDADPGGTVTDYTASIAWGDGNTSAGTIAYNSSLGYFTVTGTDTYADEGTYHPNVSIQDAGGAGVGVIGTVTVADAALTLTASAISAVEGAPYNGTVATFTDANTLATASDFTATITWGDTTSSSGVITYNSSTHQFQVAAGHTYAEEGSYSAGVTIHDVGGNSATKTATATVADAPLTATGLTVTPVEGASFTGTVATFTDADPGGTATDYTATITWGDGGSSAGTIAYNAALGAFTVTGTHTYLEEGHDTTSVSILDAGGASATVGGTANVADAPLTANGETFSATEGAAFSGEVASFTDADPGAVVGDFTATIQWGDASTSSGTVGYDSTRHVYTVTGSHTYTEGITLGAIIIINDAGGASALAATTANVADAALSSSGVTLSQVEGGSFTGTVATFTDADPGAVTSDYWATITWGDAHVTTGTVAYNSAQGKYTVAGSNAYLEDGSYSLSVAIRDKGGASTTATGTATVTDAVPSLTAIAIAPVEGIAFTGTVATFTDPVPIPSSFTATINWGDGTSSAGTITYNGVTQKFSIAGTHAYAEEGTDTVTVTLNDVGGKTATATATATVADAPLSLSVSSLSLVEGAAFSGVLATFTDADPGGITSDYSATINWGNGTNTAGTIAYDSVHKVYDVSGSITYADEGTDTISVTVKDSGGASATMTAPATVVDAAITATAATITATEGVSYTGSVATFTDANPNGTTSDFTATIAWGDGTTSNGAISYNASTKVFTVTGPHTYIDEGVYGVTVQIKDVGGSSARIVEHANVADAPCRPPASPSPRSRGRSSPGWSPPSPAPTPPPRPPASPPRSPGATATSPPGRSPTTRRTPGSTSPGRTCTSRKGPTPPRSRSRTPAARPRR